MYCVFVIVKIACLFTCIAYYVLMERKIMASVQRRRGPNVTGFWGLLQPLADGLKLFAKEMVLPSHANQRVFLAAPITILTLSLASWTVIPFCNTDLASRVEAKRVLPSLLNNIDEGNKGARYMAQLKEQLEAFCIGNQLPKA